MPSSRTRTTSTASCSSIATAWPQLEGSPYREVTLYDAVRPARDGNFGAGSYLYFERRVLEEMRVSGRRAATKWLEAGPRVDRLETPAEGAAA